MRGSNHFERLPDGLVAKILSGVSDARDIQRVAVCCRSFRLLAQQSEELKFDGNALSNVSMADFELGVTMVLARVRKASALRSVTVLVRREEQLTEGTVVSWIAAVSNDIESFTVYGRRHKADMNKQLEIASHCPRLRILTLPGSSICPVQTETISRCQGGFKLLEELQLSRLQFSDKALHDLVALCTKLRRFFLENVSGLKEVSLESGTLEIMSLRSFGEGFARVLLIMPKLRVLAIGDLGSSLIIKDSPLEELYLWNCSNQLEVDLGAKQDLIAFTVEQDPWPPLIEVGNRVAFSWYAALLNFARPESLRVMHMPSVEASEVIPLADTRNFFKHVGKVEEIALPASFLSACVLDSVTPPGAPLSEKERAHLVFEGLLFPHLLEIKIYLEIEDCKDCFHFIEAYVRCCPSLERLIVHADSGVDEYEIPGVLVSSLLGLQRANFRQVVTLELPEKLVLKD